MLRFAALLLHVTGPLCAAVRSGRTLAVTFPIPIRIEFDSGTHDLKSCVSVMAVTSRASMETKTDFAIDELGRDIIRFRSNGLMEAVRFLRDGDRLYILHRGDTISVVT